MQFRRCIVTHYIILFYIIVLVQLIVIYSKFFALGVKVYF